jgi:hypothetical protein
MKTYIVILFSIFLFGNSTEVLCQDIYDYSFRNKLIQNEKIKSIKITSEIDGDIETDFIYFDSLGNNITSVLYSSLSNDTSYSHSEYIDTLISLEYLINSLAKSDTTFIARYTYNKSNQLRKKEAFFLNDKNEISQVSTYQYDDTGKIKLIEIEGNKNKTVQVYQYDYQNRLSIINQSGSRIISQIEYEYLENKIIKREILRESGNPYHITTSTFDSNDNLIEEIKNQANQYEHTFKYIYKNNLLKNIINTDGSIINIEYQY